MDQRTGLLSVLGGINQFRLTGFLRMEFRILIDIAVSVTGNGDGFLPVAHAGLDSLHNNGGTENRAIQDSPDGAVGALVHLLQVIFLHTGVIWRNGGALHSHTVLLRRLGGVHRHLVVRLVAVFQSQIIILCIQINIWKKKLLFDHLPEDSCHLVSIHLHKGRGHLNFFHVYLLLSV